MKKLVSILCAIALVVLAVAPFSVSAAEESASFGPTWTRVSSNEWKYQNGTDTSLTARIDEGENTLYIDGTGAVPAYSRNCLGNRPWHGSSVTKLVISKGVTSIGAEAFSNLKYLYNVSMPVSVFIEDSSAFDCASDNCIFRFSGMDIVSRDVGTVPFTSLDSISRMMVKYQDDYRFILDNYYMIGMVNNSAGVGIRNVAPADAITTAYNSKYPLYDLTSTVSVVKANGNAINKVYATCKLQGDAALEVFSLVIGDMKFGASYNIASYDASGAVKRTSTPVQYVMTIPAALQSSGRQFSLIQIGTGEVNILQDEDSNDATITFTTDYGATAYALCYTD